MSGSVTRLNAALEGRYRIESELGEGGMATVYLADDLRHERKVALKVLKPELAAVVGAERFLAEIKTTANLQHPHILPLHDSGEADGFLFYVMPYIEGESLRERLEREKQLPVDEAVRIATDVAEALHAAHEQGVIHRDIKPANILLSRGRPLVTDFGIALAVSAAGGGRLTETGLSMGTPHYMSPEQATGGQQVAPTTDVYALGCVLYEMLVGEPPYTGGTAQAILGQIIAGESVTPTKKRSSIPANVDAAIRKALEKLPADRFTSVQDFAKALADSGYRHRDESALAMLATGAGAWKRVSMGLAVTAVVFGSVAAWALLRPEDQQGVARVHITYPDTLEPYTLLAPDLDVSPDGSAVVVSLRNRSGGPTSLWLRRLSQLSPVPIPGADGGSPRFSPEGRSIAFTRNGGLLTLPLAGGSPQIVLGDSVSGRGLAWAADGSLYFKKLGLGIFRVSATGGPAEEVTAPEAGEEHLWPDALPSGNGILFTRSGGGPTQDSIAVASLETGEIRVLFQGAMARFAHSGHIVYASGDGTLLAAPFDEDRLELTGPSRALQGEAYVSPSTSGSYFAVSAAGVLVYRPRSARSAGLVPTWVSRDGSIEVLDSTLNGRMEAPDISPDGTKVALQYWPDGAGDSGIWVYDLDQETFSPVTFGGNNSRPFWSPDGAEVGFLSDRDGLGAIYSVPLDLSREPRLVRNHPDAPILEALWTSSAQQVVYRVGIQGSGGAGYGLHLAAPRQDSTSSLLADRAWAPSLSPDGRWLAYTSGQSGRAEVWVRSMQGSGGQEQVSNDGGTRPLWADSGREIIYLTGSTRSGSDAADGDWVVATVRTDPEFKVESRERFASAEGFISPTTTQQFDVSVDGQRMLALRRMGGAEGVPAQDVVVLNFFEELKRLVPN